MRRPLDRAEQLANEQGGRESAIPPCCRDWFSRVWVPLIRERLWDDPCGELHGVSAPRRDPAGVSYVRCPSCRLAGAAIVVRRTAPPASCSPPLTTESIRQGSG